MNAPDDEALARELHRELNVGPRRRQRRPPPPPRKREAQGKRERPDAESTEDGSTTDDSDDFSTRVPPKTSPGLPPQRPSETGEPVDERMTHNKPAPAASAGFERSAPTPAAVHQRSESLPPCDTPDASGIRPKLKAVVPGIPLTKAKSVQPTSARKHPSTSALASPPNKKHKSTAYTPTKPKQPIRDPAHTNPPVVAVQPAMPPKPTQPQSVQHGQHTAGQIPRAPKKPAATPAAAATPRATTPRAAPSAVPATSPDKPASGVLPLVFKGPGVVQPATASTSQTPSRTTETAASAPAGALQIAPLHLKQEASARGAQSSVEQQTHAKRSRVNESAPTYAPQASARVPLPPVKRDASTPQLPAAPSAAPATKTPPAGSATAPAARASPAQAPKPERVPAKADRSPAKADKSPAIADRPPIKGDRSPAKGEKRPAEAERLAPHAAKAPMHPGKSPAQSSKQSLHTDRPPAQAERPPPKHTDKSPAKVESQPAKVDRPLSKPEKSPVRVERSPVKADKLPTQPEKLPTSAHTPQTKGEPVAKAEPITRVKLQEQQASAKHESDMRTASRAPQPSNTAVATPEPQGTAANRDQPPANLSAAEANARKAAYDWLSCFPPDHEPGMFLCQDAKANFCVWLPNEESTTRAALGNAVSMHYPLCTIPSNKFEDVDITMVDMRERKYMHFCPRATQTADMITWDDAIATTTHMLIA